MVRPLFVVTAPRSGSTLVVALLDSHPRIAMTNEAAWVTFLRKSRLLASTPAMRTIDDGEGFRTPGFLPERYVADFRAAFSSVVRPFVVELYRRLGGHDFDLYGDKLLSLNDLEFAMEHFGDAAFVHLVRDPRDIVASTYAFQQKQPTAWQDATFDTRLAHLDRFFRGTSELLAGRDSLVLRYEDLIGDVERRASELFGFLGLEPTDEVRSFLRQGSKDLFARQGTSASPGASIGRWKKDLTPEQQRAANQIFDGHLRRLGYVD